MRITFNRFVLIIYYWLCSS